MASKASLKALEQFLALPSQELELIAARVQYDAPTTQSALVQFLQDLSATAEQLRQDFTAAMQGLPDKDREIALSSLEESGLIKGMSLLAPLLKDGRRVG